MLLDTISGVYVRGLLSMPSLWEALGVSLLCILCGYLFHKLSGERFFSGLSILAGVWVLSGSLGGLGRIGDTTGGLIFIGGAYLIYRYVWNSRVNR